MCVNRAIHHAMTVIPAMFVTIVIGVILVKVPVIHATLPVILDVKHVIAVNHHVLLDAKVDNVEGVMLLATGLVRVVIRVMYAIHVMDVIRTAIPVNTVYNVMEE